MIGKRSREAFDGDEEDTAPQPTNRSNLRLYAADD